MSVSKESLERLFAEQVGRPIDPADAEAAAVFVNIINGALNAVDPEPIFRVEPSIVFQPGYGPEKGGSDERG